MTPLQALRIIRTICNIFAPVENSAGYARIFDRIRQVLIDNNINEN